MTTIDNSRALWASRRGFKSLLPDPALRLSLTSSLTTGRLASCFSKLEEKQKCDRHKVPTIQQQPRDARPREEDLRLAIGVLVKEFSIIFSRA